MSSKTPIRLYGGALLSECRTTILGMLLPHRVRAQVAKTAAGDKVHARPDTCSWRAEHLLLAKKLPRGILKSLPTAAFS